MASSLDVGFAEEDRDDAGDIFQSSSFRESAAIERARERLLAEPNLRPLSASAVASRTGLPLSAVRAAIKSIATSAANGRQLQIGSNASLDAAIVQVGVPASPATSASSSFTPRLGFGSKHIAIKPLSKSGFNALVAAVPPLAQLPEERLRLIAGVDVAEASGIDPSNPAIYIVEAGDFPSKIAQKLTGNQARWPELVAANSPPKTKTADGNFKFLSAGEALKLPASWVVSAPAAPPAPGLPQVPGLPPVAGVQWDYVVQAGDFPFAVAQKLTGNGGRWTELKTANPQKAIQGPGDSQPGNFKQFNAGEVIHLPDSWAQFVAVVPPPLGVVPRVPAGVPVPPGLPPAPPGATPPGPGPAIPIPPLPGVPGGPGGFQLPPGQVAVPVPGLPGVTADAGVYAQTQALLAAWMKHNTKPPMGSPQDFGTFAGEFTGAETPRSKQALASYQAWANVNKAAGLRTDGQIDTATYLSLTVTVGELLAARGGGDGSAPKKEGAGAGLLAIGGLIVGGLTLLK